MADNTVRGRFVWHELVTPNAKGAHEFYSKAVGWKTQGWEQDSTYQMFVASTGPLGATVESRDGVPQWVHYIGTTDVDATVEKAKSLGAKVTTEPTTLPNAGRYAVLTDPNDATFGVHGSSGAPAPEKDPEYGEFCWHELATTVGAVEAFAFYKELFGWDDLGQHDMGPIGIYLLFGRNGRQLGGMFKKGSVGKPGAAYWVGYVRTSNVDKMAEDVKAARGMVLMGPDSVPGGHRVAQFEDPHGAFFAGHTLAQDVNAAPAKKPPAPAKPAPAPAKAAPAVAKAAPAPAKAAVAPAKAAVAPAAPAKATVAPAKAAVAPAKAAPAKPAAKPAAAPKPKKKAAKKKAAKKKAAKKGGKKVAKKKAGKKGPKKAAKKAAKKTKRAAAKKPAKGAKKKAKRR